MLALDLLPAGDQGGAQVVAACVQLHPALLPAALGIEVEPFPANVPPAGGHGAVRSKPVDLAVDLFPAGDHLIVIAQIVTAIFRLQPAGDPVAVEIPVVVAPPGFPPAAAVHGSVKNDPAQGQSRDAQKGDYHLDENIAGFRLHGQDLLSV